MPYFIKKVRIGIADGEILVFGPFATLEEAEDDDCAQVETPAQFIAVC